MIKEAKKATKHIHADRGPIFDWKEKIKHIFKTEYFKYAECAKWVALGDHLLTGNKFVFH